MRTRITLLIAMALVAGALLLYVARHDPAASTVSPPCFFREATGWHCAGCGATRATHALLHFEVGSALRMNPLWVMALPFAVAAILMEGAAWVVGPRYSGPRLRLPVSCAWWLPGVLVAVWILRNVPAWPFYLMAPD
jgi:hypothetical protein